MTAVIDTADDGRRSALRAHEWRLLIGGALRPALEGRTYATESPADGLHLADVPDADQSDVAAAVAAGLDAYRDWAAVSVRERAAALRRLAGVLRANVDELAYLDTIDCGHPYHVMQGDVEHAADVLDIYADWSLQLGGETVPVSPEHLHYTVREPWGVVAKIVPYNHPIMFCASRIAAPLLAGNAVIVKAPHQTPLSALRMGELFSDELPRGLLSVLTGAGPATGEALVRHRDIRRIGFIGSVPTGQAILKTAAESGIKSVSLELGGKNAMIVFPDSDPVAAASAAVRGMNFHWSAGQSCGSTSRLLLHESVYDEVVDRVAEQVDGIHTGDLFDPRTGMGAVVSNAQYNKVMYYIGAAIEDGASLRTGGGRPDDKDAGYWIRPTVFAEVRPEHRVAREEIFGPVLSVMRWRSEEEAIALANSVPYGLTAAIWTRDIARAHRVARQIDAGFVWINDVARHFIGVPYGGFKDSGIGTEESIADLRSYTQTKAINVSLST